MDKVVLQKIVNILAGGVPKIHEQKTRKNKNLETMPWKIPKWINKQLLKNEYLTKFNSQNRLLIESKTFRKIFVHSKK